MNHTFSSENIKPVNYHHEAQSHPFWSNNFLCNCANGSLDEDAFRHFFGQYYFYAKRFTRLLATIMVKCDDDHMRAKLTHNFWEESGERDTNKSHAEIFRDFMKEGLNIDLSALKPMPYTTYFIESMINLCLESEADACAAILAYATEGIVPRLYSIFRDGLRMAGLHDRELLFFDLHIECDDGHADILDDVVNSYCNELGWHERCSRAISKALDLRSEFFNNIYFDLSRQSIDGLVGEVVKNSYEDFQPDGQVYVANRSEISNTLYEHESQGRSINFKVNRVPFKASVMDPRFLMVEPWSITEKHSHAHESIFYVIRGNGCVMLGDNELTIEQDSVVYVPRWVPHQTRNLSDNELVIFAITDFNFTKKILGSSAELYREKNDFKTNLKLVEGNNNA